LEWYSQAYGIRFVSLRYFNAAGATLTHGEDHKPETHLIPRVMQAAMSENNTIDVYGTDYPTRDGSCIRDYIHVADIARAHIQALEHLETLNGKAYNLGSGTGFTVLEVIEAVKRASGKTLNIKLKSRREGDPATLIASSQLARNELGWKPQYNDLNSIVESAWHWAQRNPHGYNY
jgi:UDP-glucose 4-epimerase